MRFKSILLSVLLLTVLAACGGASSTPLVPPASVPTMAPASAQQIAATTPAPTKTTSTPSPTISPQPIVPPPSPATVMALSDTGPWLVYPRVHGVMAINADDTGRRLLTNQPVLSSNLRDGIAAANGWVALRMGVRSLDELSTTPQTATVSLIHLPNGLLKPITPLFSPKMEQAIKSAHGNRTDAIEAGVAILENSNALAWSPDGRYLAFIAAIDGPSSDVYCYDRESGKINRLTDGPNQAARLFWSPDSQWIVHEEVESFGTGAGWNVKAVWAAAPDGNNTRKIYDATSSGDEVFVEWLAPNKFFVYSWTPVGWRNARAVDLNTGAAQLIGPKFEVQTLAYDPQSQTQLYFVDDFTAQQKGLSGGLYFAAAGQAKLIASGDWYDTRWLPQAQLFFAKGRAGVISVAVDGTVKKYDGEEALPIDAPDGAWLLAWGDGNYTSPIGLRLYTLDGEVKRTITSDSVTFATWSPDSNGAFYQSDGQLYFVEIPNGEPQSIGETTARELSNIGWVKP